ncbi:extensin-like [Lathyrus oleraceus]|uniref:extensin-like n=1 Tax=Pisum sativum TaxID=3888 RepID=UPI0021D00FEB|nr:extensin-like [Pisum sativum]
MKRKREPSEKSKKSKTLKLGEPSASKSHVPLDSSVSSKFHPSETPSNSNLKQLCSSLPQPSSTYTPFEPTISIPPTSEYHNSNLSSPPPRQINLTTTTFLTSKTSPLNESLSPLSLTPSSPTYYDISSDAEQLEIPDPSSLTLAQLQAITISNQPPFISDTYVPSSSKPQIEPPSKPQIEHPTEQPSEPPTKTIHTSLESINPSFEPEPTFPTLEESVALFSESSIVKLKSLSE